MKYIIILPDGMADLPIKKLKNKTPLEYASTPHMDYMVQNGKVGAVHTIPKNMNPGSDIANMSILGINPKKISIGRGALESLAMGINIDKSKIIFRANFVTVHNNRMIDYTGGNIKSKEGKKLITYLNKNLRNYNIKFIPGLDYRNIAVLNKSEIDLQTTPPHDITNKKITNYLPKGSDSKLIKNIMYKTRELLNQYKTSTNMMWLWGEGKIDDGISFFEKYKLKGAVISAVDIIKGIAKLLKMNIIKVPGITGDIDTNYSNKAKAVIRNLNKYDFIFVHIEATDETGHRGNYKEKIKAIENIDKYIVGKIINSIDDDTVITLLPDHPTPCKLKTHTSEPVPFVIYSKKKNYINKKFTNFSEKICKNPPITIKHGYKLLDYILKEVF